MKFPKSDPAATDYTKPTGTNLALGYIVQNFTLNHPVHSEFCNSMSFPVKFMK